MPEAKKDRAAPEKPDSTQDGVRAGIQYDSRFCRTRTFVSLISSAGHSAALDGNHETRLPDCATAHRSDSNSGYGLNGR